ncbi:MAG: hypothetical protein MUD01_02710 [Chloroflexaceae bacterium]|jgi:hypothetical protein|nr:hypothetical protein [Chloroflexaceae bacterium]
MLRFHKRTFALLGAEAPRQERSIATLVQWAHELHITLPAAFVEWVRFDDGTLLTRYSNDDWFWLNQPKLVETPDGVRGLRFSSENQNNFSKIVTLDQGDDPPVLFAWLNQPPWVMHSERFSDAILAQLFDWQYWLEFRPDDPTYKEIAYTGEIQLASDDCLPLLLRRYEAFPTTAFVVDDEHYHEYRFMQSHQERITVTVGPSRQTTIRITGESSRVPALEARLRRLLSPAASS